MTYKSNLTTLQKVVIILLINMFWIFILLCYYLIMDHGLWTPAVKAIFIYLLPFVISAIYLGLLGFVEQVGISKDKLTITKWYFKKKIIDLSSLRVKILVKETLFFNPNGVYLFSFGNQTKGVLEATEYIEKVDSVEDLLVPSYNVMSRGRILFLFALILSVFVIFLGENSVFWIIYLFIDGGIALYSLYLLLFKLNMKVFLSDKDVNIRTLFGKENQFIKKNMKYQKNARKLVLFYEGKKIITLPSSDYIEIGSLVMKLKVEPLK